MKNTGLVRLCEQEQQVDTILHRPISETMAIVEPLWLVVEMIGETICIIAEVEAAEYRLLWVLEVVSTQGTPQILEHPIVEYTRDMVNISFSSGIIMEIRVMILGMKMVLVPDQVELFEIKMISTLGMDQMHYPIQ